MGVPFTQHELARICGLGVNQISRYEHGASDPAAENLKFIARELGVSTDYLLGMTDERKLLDVYRREGWPGVFHLEADKVVAKI